MKIAIYSRKSKFTGKGESIENQITLCREYIALHIPEAQNGDIFVFEDEGFSAKNLDRPQFKAMMANEQKEKFDYIVVYRLDRISRNVGDFAGLIDKLNTLGTAFICIKEQFDTSTPMGRAMMNIAAVFAQLERETIAERVCDNLLMLARTGRWLGGITPLGFKGEKVTLDDDGKQRTAHKLVSVPDEIAVVKLIFKKFLELQSMTKTMTYLIQNGIKTRRGTEFSCRAIKDILKNPVYCKADKAVYEHFTELGSTVCFELSEICVNQGLMPFRRTMNSGKQQARTVPEEWIIALGKHNGIIDSEHWLKVQLLIGENADKTFYRNVRNEISIFSGLVRCGNCGSVMRPRAHSSKRRTPDGTQTFSYMCEFKERSRMSKCKMRNVNGNTLDKLLCDEILKFGSPDSTVSLQLRKLAFHLDSETGREQIDWLNKSIESKKKMIANLMSALAKADDSSAMYAYTSQQIEQLDEEIKALAHQRQELLFSTDEIEKAQSQYDSILNNLSCFKNCFEALSVVEKREYIRSIVERIEWDGETAHLFLYGADVGI